MLKERAALLTLIAKSVDILIYALSAIISFFIQFKTLSIPGFYQLSILLALLLINPVFAQFGVYQSLRGQSFAIYFRRLYFAFVVLIMILAALSFITKTGSHFSRAWFLWWHCYAIVLLTCFRIGLRQLLSIMRKKGFNQKRVIIIGSGELVTLIVQSLANALRAGFSITAIFDNTGKQIEVEGITVQKVPADVANYVKENHIDEVWLVLALWDRKEAENLLHKLRLSIVTIRYFPDFIGINPLNQSISEFLEFPVINVVSSPMTGTNRFIKAIEDRILAVIILILISPLLLFISILVKISSPGPIFYRQKRIGWNGKEFEMLKFRSMPVDAEMKTGAVWATESDRRATKIGAFLRKTSLDELPQFINVLKGDMSIVGPRPERPMFVEKFKHEIPLYMQKHLVKAGITGWAQVNGWRGNTSLEKRIEYDLYYIAHWSLWFDLEIIFLTIFKGFVNKNAY